ncbi:hypothetical protein BJY52DRAFT_156157 [Lactarius psammicola]|nr:hypothetical protein BJY52DRAFT_156157 [Lactarius psammicola]
MLLHKVTLCQLSVQRRQSYGVFTQEMANAMPKSDPIVLSQGDYEDMCSGDCILEVYMQSLSSVGLPSVEGLPIGVSAYARLILQGFRESSRHPGSGSLPNLHRAFRPTHLALAVILCTLCRRHFFPSGRYDGWVAVLRDLGLALSTHMFVMTFSSRSRTARVLCAPLGSGHSLSESTFASCIYSIRGTKGQDKRTKEKSLRSLGSCMRLPPSFICVILYSPESSFLADLLSLLL